MDEFIVADLLEAVDDYRKAKETYDNDPSPEYGVGTWGAETEARISLNNAFKEAVMEVISKG